MIAELGTFSLALAFALSLAAAALSIAARVRGASVLRGAGEGAAGGIFLSMLLAFFCLMAAFVRSDFSVENVAQHSHTAQPLLYKITGVWGSHEGSMILWCLLLSGYGAIVALTGRNMPWKLKTLTVAVQSWLCVLFIGYTLFASSPFVRIPPPVDGSLLNPILQDWAFAVHPPFLYLGYLCFSVVFSFALSALIDGKLDAAWARWVRPWALAAWSLLTIGITLGSFWAYYELGWGGWWAWDPVENASFMPWLVGTALLHSAIVTEKRGALKGWTTFLAIASFGFAIFGTFMVRSGAIQSVHAFAVDPSRGLALLSILAVTAGVGFSLFAWRVPSFSPGGVYAQVSRETTLVLNNVFIGAATLTVLGGTLAPLIGEAITGRPLSLGAPYFNLTFGVVMAFCLLLVPAGPLIPWKRGDLRGVFQRLTVAGVLAILAGVAAALLVHPRQVVAAIGGALGLWLIAGSLTELAGRGGLGKVGGAEFFRRLGGLPRGAWGMTLAHMGLGVFVLGACIEIGGKVERAQVMAPGETLQVGAYAFRLDSVAPVEGPTYLADRGTFTVTRNGAVVCRGEPERRVYTRTMTPTTEVAICGRGLSHLYIVLGDKRPTADGRDRWLVTGYFNPWAMLIFLGPVLMALGGAVSLTDRRLRLGVAARSRVGSGPAKAREAAVSA